MRCETCRGTGRLVVPLKIAPELRGFVTEPCRDCGGSGWAHCCEGERPDCATPSPPAEGERRGGGE